jgi:DNA-binding NtrC family response regulator
VANILIIDENLDSWRPLQAELDRHHKITCWSVQSDILSHLKKYEYEIILLSLQLRGADSFDLLDQVARISPHTPIIALSENEDPALVVEVIKNGAFDFLVKPFSKEKLLLAIERSLENRHLKNELDYLKREQDIIYDFSRIIAESPAMKRMIATLKKFAQTDSTILITGETGTGKSFLSGAVHYNSRRRSRPFIKINCANLPETLLESELFGHEKGSFTGANKTRVGRLEQAREGTVFLDEIGEMSGSLQAKLLRVLEEKSFERVGGNRTIHSDVRIIAATNRRPEDQVTEGNFREDLYYRLNVLRVHLPPLRERDECVVPLAEYLLSKICRNLKKKIDGFTPEVIAAFARYSWPGNIRQLANTIERAAILEDTGQIRMQHIILPDFQNNHRAEPANPTALPTPAESLLERERETILHTLEDCLWIQKDAARRLGITPRALNYKIKKYRITHPRWRVHK